MNKEKMNSFFKRISDENAAISKDKHSFRLFINCPKCKGEANYWCHVACLTTTYIDDEGFIYCENSTKGKLKCQKVFIQKARFNCSKQEHGIEYVNFESLGDFLMAMGAAVNSIENSEYDQNKFHEFVQRLTKNISKHWKFC